EIARGVRRVSTRRAARLPGVGDRGEAARHAREAHRHHDRVAEGGQAAQLEVRAAVKLEPEPPVAQAALLDSLRAPNLAFMAMHPGDPPRRQPVHVVYGGGHLFRADTAAKLGDVARRALVEYAPDPGALDEALGLGALAVPVYARVVEKLA